MSKVYEEWCKELSDIIATDTKFYLLLGQLEHALQDVINAWGTEDLLEHAEKVFELIYTFNSKGYHYNAKKQQKDPKRYKAHMYFGLRLTLSRRSTDLGCLLKLAMPRLAFYLSKEANHFPSGIYFDACKIRSAAEFLWTDDYKNLPVSHDISSKETLDCTYRKILTEKVPWSIWEHNIRSFHGDKSCTNFTHKHFIGGGGWDRGVNDPGHYWWEKYRNAAVSGLWWGRLRSTKLAERQAREEGEEGEEEQQQQE